MAELGSHQLDAAAGFIAAAQGGEPPHPLNVAGAANRAVFSSGRDVEDHVFCILEYPAPGYDPKDPIAGRKKIGVQYASIGGNAFGGYGEIIYGSRGTYLLEGEQEWSIARSGGTSTVKAAAAGSGPTLSTQASVSATATKTKETISLGFTEELEHWAWCIRNPAAENQPRCGPQAALANAVIALAAQQAARQGERKEFQKEWLDIHSDATPEGDAPHVSGAKSQRVKDQAHASGQ
jgi:predicted dehydrogenase